MGALFIAEPCSGCGYQPRQLLRYHVGSLGLFVGIATCRACEEITSMFPSRANIGARAAQMAALEAPHRYIAYVQKLLRQQPAAFPPGFALDTCPLCGSQTLYFHHLWEDPTPDSALIELPCPRCISGRLRLLPQGTWD